MNGEFSEKRKNGFCKNKVEKLIARGILTAGRMLAVLALAVCFCVPAASCAVGKTNNGFSDNTTDTKGQEADMDQNTETPGTRLPEGEDGASGHQCLVPSEKASEWIKIYEERFGAGSSEKVIMEGAAIDSFNRGLVASADYMIDIKSFEDGVKEIGAEKLKAWISSGSTLSVAFDIDGRRFTEEELEDIKANRNLDKAGTFTPVRAIVCERADLRTVPYGGPMLKAAGDTYYDRLQETELVLGMPVWVLHESSDGLFYYVQSYFYRGWVSRETVAAAKSEEEWMYFADPESFVVVTDALVKLGGKSVDMGVKLPAVKSEDGGKYTVTIPAADAEGFLVRENAEISALSAHEGYVPYTMKNYYIQAFKYEGTMYGWGGMNDGVDCSGFVCAVFRSFGFELPRNTSQQNKIMGELVSLSDMSAVDRARIFDVLDVPAAVYKPGHVMLWLGKSGEKYYIIHAPQGGSKVSAAEISAADTKLSELSRIK